MKYVFTIFIFIAFLLNVVAQDHTANILNSKVKPIDYTDLTKILDSTKRKTVFYTYVSWCEPSNIGLPYAIELKNKYDVDIFVIFLESQKDKRIIKTAEYLLKKYPKIQFMILNDEVYGNKVKKRCTKFTKQFTPLNGKSIPGYGQFIVFNELGKCLYVSSYLDIEGNWRDIKPMIDKKIIPLII